MTTAMLFGCDPTRRIEMKNKSDDTAYVVWRIKEDSIGHNPFNISNNRELKFTLRPHKKSKVKLSFGHGTWSPSEVEKLIGGLESFELSSRQHKIKIDSLPLLKEYLLARRKGIGAKIEILVTQ